jgi:ketosteroid isomerase-like protein
MIPFQSLVAKQGHRPPQKIACKMTDMLATKDAQLFAKDWCSAWNSHDLETILSHYADDVVLSSPIAARLLKDPRGIVNGKEGLRNYFSVGLTAYPDLRFEVLDVTCGVGSMVVYYVNQNGTKTSEYMELDSAGKVCKVIAHYSA